MDALWKQSLREGALGGSLAALLSAGVLALCGGREAGRPLAPLNAVSHWLWGDEALRADGASLRHTGVGYLSHHLSAVFWAVLYARAYGHRPEAKRLPQAVAGALAATATAAAIDYTLVPRRFTPGFERRVSTGATVGAFGAIAAGLVLGAVLLRRQP